MEQFKNTEVVLLPTENETDICLNIKTCKLNNVTTRIHNCFEKFQHLYIISDDKTKKGDWVIWFGKGNLPFLKKVIDERDNEWLLSSTYDMWVEKSKSKKIITTTDTSLKIKTTREEKITQPGVYEKSLPQPPQEWIKYYIEKYNKGEIITDVLVEYELIPFSSIAPNRERYSRLKINPKDNTITIKKAGETLKDIMKKNPDIREEVVQLLNEVIKQSKEQYSLLDRLGLDKWIEQNL